MIRNYVKIALRKLINEKLLSFIVLFGLTVSLLVCLLIGLFVKDELSYDDFQSNKDRIVLFQQWENSSGSGSGFAPLLKRNIAQAEEVTRVIKAEPLITNGSKTESYYEKNFCFAEANFPKVFNLNFIESNAATAFATPNFLLLSKSTAIKYFGHQPAIGKLLFYDKNKPFYVTGVFDDLPHNSHIKIDFLCDYKQAQTLVGQSLDGYWDGMSLTYLLLSKGTSTTAISKQLPQIISHLHDQNSVIWKPRFIPLKDIYLREKLDGRIQASNAIVDVYVFTAIALCIILLAAFNYVNMTTANAVSHIKSVGVRRILGAQRKQLIQQYLIESFVFVGISATLAWAAAFVGVVVFNAIAHTTLSSSVLYSGNFVFFYVGSVLLFAVVNGLYPAYFLSSFKPFDAIRKRIFNVHRSDYSLRKALVVFQFTISIIMMIVVVVVSRQLQYIHNQNLGYNRDEVLTFAFPSDASSTQKQTFLNKMAATPDVSNATVCSRLPGEGAFGNKLVETYVPAGKEVAYQNFSFDQHYLGVFGIRLLQGRNFSATDNAEQHHFIINQTMCALLNLTNNAVGKPLAYYTYQYSPDGGYKEVPVKGDIIGVVDDYHQNDLRTAIQPLLIQYNAGWENEVAVKLQSSRLDKVLSTLNKEWKNNFPITPFQYRFLDDVFNQTYQKDTITGSALNVFSVLAIIISCLGLLGLTTISVQQKVKEIGIRKVLGASVTNITLLIAKDYVVLIVIAIVLAVPISLFASSKWLQIFIYRIHIQWWMFAIAGITAIIIAFITVSLQAIKAAMMNPVKSLRTE